MKTEEKVVQKLQELKYHISCCESCTGGMIISTLINVCGASSVINESYVTYSIPAKCKILGVKQSTIDKYHVESKEVAEEMVEGLQKLTKSEVCISVTGYAASTTKQPTDGLCFYGIKVKDQLFLEKIQVKGSRNVCRKKQVTHILNRVYEIIKGLS